MSVENGTYSARRPREVIPPSTRLPRTTNFLEAKTLGTLSHNASAIPLPPSAMKRSASQMNMQQAPHTTNHVRTTSGSRMSLAPGRPAQPMFHRASSNGNLGETGFATGQRHSTANFLQPTSTRKSYAPVASTPARQIQIIQDSAQRRSSVYSARPSAAFGVAGHQSFFATAPPINGIPTDPRRLRDSNVRQQMGTELLEFLTERNFELEMKHTLTHRSVSQPTQKDFVTIFQFLYHCIDPSYRFLKGVDTEVPALLKQLRYPFEKSITKSQLTAAGGNHWPIFLGMLHWMMNLTKMTERYSTGTYDDACIEAGYDVSSDRITFQFLSDAYKEWLSIEDDDDDEEEAKRRIQPHIDVMAERFEKANEANLEQLRQLEAESKALQEQIDALSKTAPKLAKLDETIKVLEEDRVKFENYNTSMEAKVEKYINRAELIRQEIEKCDTEVQEAEEDRDELQRKVDEQGFSVTDIDRMNTERDRLQKGVETTSARLDESKDRMTKKEDETAAKLEELEALAQRHNELGYQIGIIPAKAVNAHGHEYEIRLALNAGPDFTITQMGGLNAQNFEADRLLSDAHNGYQPRQILSRDLKASRRTLQDLRKEVSEKRNTALEEDMAKVDMLDKTKEALDDKYAEMEGLGHRLHAAAEEFEKTKEIANAQNMASDAQIERMEKELAKMRASLTDSVQLMEQREMNINIEHDELSVRSSALREELHTELERMLNDIIKFKIHVQKSLEAYEEFVAQEFEREVEEQEAAAPLGSEDEEELIDDMDT